MNLYYCKRTQKERAYLRMNIKEKLIRPEYQEIFMLVIIGGVMLLPQGTEYFLLLGALIWMAVQNISAIRGGEGLRKKYNRTDLAVFLFLAYEVLHMIGQMIWADEEKGIDYGINVFFIAMTLLYFLCAEIKTFRQSCLDAVIYAGLPVMGVILYCDLCDVSAAWLLGGLMESRTELAAYIMLPGMVSVLQYCRCRNKVRRLFYGLSAGLSFFLLLIRHHRISLWLLLFFFLLIPVVMRPTAELIKRAMQMFVLYMLMLCNMSLLVNYTELVLTEVSYDLRQSVYLELFLVLGAAVFFHYWDRIPEGTPLEKVVLRKVYRIYRYLIMVLTAFFIALLAGGSWGSLSGHAGAEFVGKLAEPLHTELMQTENFLYACAQKQGLPVLVGLLFVSVSIGIRLKKKTGWDRPVTTGLWLLAVMGAVQCLLGNPGIRTLPVYLLLAVSGMRWEEERMRFTGVRIRDLTQWKSQ